MFRKSFQIELEDSLTYPSARIICEAVESYAAGRKERLRVVSREMPVSFYLDQDLYEVKIIMIRGGYELSCRKRR